MSPVTRRSIAGIAECRRSIGLHPETVAGKGLAHSFAALVQANLDAPRTTQDSDNSATAVLLRAPVNGKRLSDDQITTILRNWVTGHGTTADAMGIVLMHVARNHNLQSQLRQTPALVPAAMEEILRMDGPLVANRRTTTREDELRDRSIPKDASLALMWMAANRDPLVFEDASNFNLYRDSSASLVWGKGIHVCMGAALARTTCIELVDAEPVRKIYPVNGFSALRLRLACWLGAQRR
jgi:cytochrome P450